MLYNMLYNPFRTRARVADPPAYPFAAGALVYAQLDSFVTRQGNGFAFLIRNPHSFPHNPSSSEPPRRRRAEPLRRSRLEGDAGAAAVLEGGAGAAAAAWRAAQIVVLVGLLQRSWTFAQVVVLVELLQRSWRLQRSWTCTRS